MAGAVREVNIIGAGLSGLSAALTLARAGVHANLVSMMPSERAQSVLAEGGTNAVLDTMGDGDTVDDHVADTMRGGCFLADEEAVRELCEEAPRIIRELEEAGVPFHRNKDGTIAARYFGGQKKRRTLFVGAFTGKMLMSALISEVRKYEDEGLVRRFDHHAFVRLYLTDDGVSCRGVRVRDMRTKEMLTLEGPVILCSGGINGMFPGHTTGTVQNNGDVTATVFAQGVAMSNLEMIQFHPTTVPVPGKRMLVTEAARGEGGRLYVIDKHTRARFYFMEERYPEAGNLMPRDVVSRESERVRRDTAYENEIFLDMTAVPSSVWQERLKELREEMLRYLSIDPAKEPVPVTPGIHYFMGGIDVDKEHRTNLSGLYAAGECCSQYHGANRLGGNSTMGAMRGGRAAARCAMADAGKADTVPAGANTPDAVTADGTPAESFASDDTPVLSCTPTAFDYRLGDILYEGLGIVRNEEGLKRAMEQVCALEQEGAGSKEDDAFCAHRKNRILLAKAMIESALERKESRGAHYREDYPETKDACAHPIRKCGSVRGTNA